MCIELVPFVLFIGLRTFEVAILHSFLSFNDTFRLEFLDIAKPQFTEREMKLKAIIKYFLVGYSVFIPIFAVIWWWAPADFDNYEIRIVWISTEFLTYLMLS